MKRRIAIFAAAFGIYAAILTAVWEIGTRQAREKTEWQLDYGVIDFHDTVAGAIDTMLGHVARIAVRHIDHVQPITMKRMSEGAKELDIDEVNIVDRNGEIIASNDPLCLGTVMAGDPVMDAFMALTNGTVATVSQPFRTSTRNQGFRAKYLGAAFPGGDGFVQVGLDERRLAKMLPEVLGYIFDEWLFGKTGFYLCADVKTGRLISNPSRHRNEAATLEETGYDRSEASQYEIVLNGKEYGETFTQTLFGEKCYCRAFLYGEHVFVAALPEREYYDSRNEFAVVFGASLFVVIFGFAFFADRLFGYSQRLKRFYAAEEARLAKDFSIAKTIQSAALPAGECDSPYFMISAAMAPAREVGGDFYDHFPVDDTHEAFLVADVSGKGITAALYMMNAKTLIKEILQKCRDPAEAFTRANAELCANNKANMFLTAWVGVLDMETGVMTYVNAGHNPPLLVRAGADKPEFMREKSGCMLSFMDGVKYKSYSLQLASGDIVFLYTDGVTEAQDVQERFFGEDRLAAAVAEAPRTARAMCDAVRARVAEFADGAPPADDLTVLALEFKAAAEYSVCSFAPEQASIAKASAFVEEKLAEGECPQRVKTAIGIILDEILSNIVRHSKASGFEVDVEFTVSPRGVKVVFIDDGEPYDPLSHKDPDTTLSAADRPIGGLGILMVKKMADEVSYRRTRNRNFLTVFKNFGAPDGAAAQGDGK